MNTRLNSVLGLTAMLLLVGAFNATPANAQTEEQPSTVGKLVHGLNPLNWSMPQWKMPDFRSILPDREEKTRIKKKKDGLFSEVTKTASNSWEKTKAAFDPEKLNPIRMFPASARTPSNRSEPKEPGFFRSLFTPAPRENEIETVNDFLRQSRPQP